MSSVSDDLGSSSRLDIDQLVNELRDVRQHWRAVHGRHTEIGVRSFPSRAVIERLVEQICGALFPARLGPPDVVTGSEDSYVEIALRTALGALTEQVVLELGCHWNGDERFPVGQQARQIVARFAQSLPMLRAVLDADVEAAHASDPAARSVDEVLICYPGMQAIVHYRLAHRLYGLGAPMVARILSEIAIARTGIDIHPGARIGRRFFIDHGTGVVIGETAVVGDNVRLHQGVTLGGPALPGGVLTDVDRKGARHPVVEDDVVIHAGATILGRVTIGAGSVIAGNVWLEENVPPGSYVCQSPMLISAPADARRRALPGAAA